MFHRIIVSIFLIGILLIIVGFVQENTYHHAITSSESDEVNTIKPDYIYDELDDSSNNEIYFDNNNNELEDTSNNDISMDEDINIES